jgi:hypothetical protein
MNWAELAALASLLGPAVLASQLRPDPPWWLRHWPQPARGASRPHLPPGWNKHPPLPAPAHPATGGGPPGWQIALAVAAVMLLAAAVTRVYRLQAARRARPRPRADECPDERVQPAATHPLAVRPLPAESGWPSAAIPPDEVSWP